MRKYKVLKWYPYKDPERYKISIVVGVYTLDDVLEHVIKHVKEYYCRLRDIDVSDNSFVVEEFNVNDMIPNLYEKVVDEDL